MSCRAGVMGMCFEGGCVMCIFGGGVGVNLGGAGCLSVGWWCGGIYLVLWSGVFLGGKGCITYIHDFGKKIVDKSQHERRMRVNSLIDYGL
jgi:hypothetical protein